VAVPGHPIPGAAEQLSGYGPKDPERRITSDSDPRLKSLDPRLRLICATQKDKSRYDKCQ